MSEAIDFVPSVKPIYDNPCDYPQPFPNELSADEAVYLAECFVIQNGYTDLPPIADKSKLTPENVFPLTDESGMRMRHDSLERKAYSYERTIGSWIIMFKIKPNPTFVEIYGDKSNVIGRAVTMDFHGVRLRMQHSPYPIGMPEAVVIKHEE